MDDLISRQAAIDAVRHAWAKGLEPSQYIEDLPPAQPEERTEERTETHACDYACDCISRQDAIRWVKTECNPYGKPTLDFESGKRVMEHLKTMPSVQPEPLSDAYMKAVWTWLLDYQIKAAELKGRYAPYEVLSWVVNDWRKEHE